MAAKIVLLFFISLASIAHANLEEFQIQDVQKKKIEFTTSKVLIYFWATWCPDCKDSLKVKLPSLRNPDVTILGVNTDAGEEKVLDYLRTEKVSIPTLLDTDKSLRKKYSVFSVPTALIFKKEKGQFTLKKTLPGADFDELKRELSSE